MLPHLHRRALLASAQRYLPDLEEDTMIRYPQYPLAIALVTLLALAGFGIAWSDDDDDGDRAGTHFDRKVDEHAQSTLVQGRQIFRFDTFGDEAFWGDTIKLHQAI